VALDILRRKHQELERKQAKLHAWIDLRSQVLTDIVMLQREVVAKQTSIRRLQQDGKDASTLHTEVQGLFDKLKALHAMQVEIDAKVTRLEGRPSR